MEQTDLGARLEHVLNSDGDPDALFAQLQQEIDRHPQDASLYTLRARLNDACGYRSPAWRDLQQAAALAPGDREAALALVAYQCRHASSLAWALSDDDEDDDAVDAKGAGLEAQAVDGLWRLMRDYAGDAAFALRLSRVPEEAHLWRPWDRYALVLTALAAHPDDWALRKQEALVLASLASMSPDVEDIPLGYFEDWYGNRMHALGVERALAAIEPLLSERPDTDLLAEQASLLTAIERLAEAAAIHARLIAIYEEQLRHAPPAVRDDLRERLERARQDHADCAGGTATYLVSQESMLASTIAHLAKLNGGSRVDELRSDADIWRRQARAMQDGPDPEMKAELDQVAPVVAGQIIGMLSEPPVALRTQRADDIDGGLAPWFDELAPGLHAAGLSLATGFENPNYTGRFGSHQGQLWTHPQGRLAVVAECVPGIQLVRVLSQLSDGSVQVTSGALGTSTFSAGPGVGLVWMLPDTPVSDMVMLHGAVLARRLAATPGLSPRPIATVAQLAQAENDMLALKAAFRRSVGVTDAEIRGMHVQYHDYFARVLKAEVAALLAAGA